MQGFDTQWPADAVEFCPHLDATDIVLCGTYNLEEPAPVANADEKRQEPSISRPQLRRGQCLVLQIGSSPEREESHIHLLQSLDLPAVPDIKWCYLDEHVNPIAAIANTEGAITLHEWQLSERGLNTLDHIQVASSDKLCLSLDWNNRRTRGTTVGSLVASLSDGHLTVLQRGEGVALCQTRTWRAHDYEPWIAAWDYWNANAVYSGGDDLTFKGWDIREGNSVPTFTKKFRAGVTTIQSHPHVESLIAVGSYDNIVRLFDVRNPLRPLAEVYVGGGAWRVKWHPSGFRKHDMAVACMHDGFKIVRFGDDFASSNIIRRFDEHTSLAYGVDWSLEGGTNEETLITSCSFYDHKLHVWKG